MNRPSAPSPFGSSPPTETVHRVQVVTCWRHDEPRMETCHVTAEKNRKLSTFQRNISTPVK